MTLTQKRLKEQIKRRKKGRKEGRKEERKGKERKGKKLVSLMKERWTEETTN